MALSSNGFSVEDRDLSAEQLAKLQSFKRLLQQAGAWDDRCFDEHDCARFLKARGYDLQASKHMWDGMLAWRRENRVNTIHDWFNFHERREYDLVFPTGLHKTDKEGHPVLIQQLGRVNIGALYKVTTDERIRLAHIAENEHLRRVVFPACSRAASRPIDQLFTIIDLEGVAFTSMMRTTSLLKMFMAMDSNNYPETLAHMAIINAPGWFSTSWSAVKSVLSGDTVRKIQILGKDYQAALLAHIPRENLLVEYGGLSRGRVTSNEGPWLEPLPEPPAPPPAKQPQQQPGAAQEAEQQVSELSNGGDQRTPRDVLTRHAQSPVRPGAKSAAGAAGAGAGGGHPAPPASPPAAKRPHQEEELRPPRSQPHSGSSPSPSASDSSSSDIAVNMAAPLMSNFLPSGDSPLHQQQGGHASPPSSAGGTLVGPQRRSSGGGLVAGFAASLQAAVAHVGYHPQQQGGPQTTAADGGVLHPPAATPVATVQRGGSLQTPLQSHPAMAARGGAVGPAQLQLTSPREDTTGPGTLFSAMSAVYSPTSAMSPLSPGDSHAAADTATSRRRDGSAGGAGLGQAAPAAAGALGPSGATSAGGGFPGGRVSCGGSAGGFSGLPNVPAVGVGVSAGGNVSVFSSALLVSGELLPDTSQQHQLDTDDSESVRFSVMSQRSFYSARSHIDPSTSSGLTSPNEASENSRRWSMQRELHAAAIASALAATAEQRRIAAANTPMAPQTAGKPGAAAGSGIPLPPAAALPGVASYIVPPAAQQAFGSYLDQPPPYGSGSFTTGASLPAAAGSDRHASSNPGGGVAAASETNGPGNGAGHRRTESRGRGSAAAGDAVITVGGEGGGNPGGASGGTMSRSPSTNAIDDCSLGAGAVRWARGWFFRRRNYGRLVESDGAAEGAVVGGRAGSGAAGAGAEGARQPGRKGTAVGPYSSMHDGPNGTSPSKVLPKVPSGAHHARTDSWEWDQPSPYDIDQTYGRAAGGIMQRDLSFGRGGERRRLLRTDSPGRRRGLSVDCGCLPCCTIM